MKITPTMLMATLVGAVAGLVAGIYGAGPWHSLEIGLLATCATALLVLVGRDDLGLYK